MTEEELAELSATDTSTQVRVSSKAYGMDAIDHGAGDERRREDLGRELGPVLRGIYGGWKTYKVWLEEEESIALKASLIKEYNLAGISAWSWASSGRISGM